jgi:hypothetical protein
VFLSKGVRADQCCAGVHATRTPPWLASCHQSSSVTSRTPASWNHAAMPSGTYQCSGLQAAAPAALAARARLPPAPKRARRSSTLRLHRWS